MVRERPPAASANARTGDDAQSQWQDLVYTAHVSLDQTEMQINERVVKLGPGTAVTVEIKTGKRRVIEYLLSPLLRYKQGALRER
jgi:hemolysin D